MIITVASPNPVAGIYNILFLNDPLLNCKAEGILVAEEQQVIGDHGEVMQNESVQDTATAVESDTRSKISEPIFGVGKIEYGIFRDIDANIDKYWYFGSLRPKAAYLFQSLKRKTLPEETEVRLSDICDGCNKCVLRDLNMDENINTDTQANAAPARKGRWWSSYVKNKPMQKKRERL